jgi:2-keto-4-pentenoate hydratase
MEPLSIQDDSIRAFVEARSRRPLPPEIPQHLRPRTIAESYRLQRAIHEHLRADGETRVGYKIGSTSAAGQRNFGLNEPVYAGIFASGNAPSLADALGRPLARPSLECEIAFILRADIDGNNAGLSDEKIADAVGSCHIACEIIDNRYGDPHAFGVPSLIADDFFHASFVIGPANPAWRTQDLANADAALDIDGMRVTGNASDVLSAYAATKWLARALAANGTKLRAGEIVMTGTITVPTAVAPSARPITLSITGFAPLSTAP